MREASVPLPEVERTMKLVISRVFAETMQTTPEPTLSSETMDQEVPAVEQEPSDEEIKVRRRCSLYRVAMAI